MKTKITKKDLIENLKYALCMINQYRQYSEEMAKEGKGFEPLGEHTSEYFVDVLQTCINNS